MDKIEQDVRIAIANHFATLARETYLANPGVLAAAKQDLIGSIDAAVTEWAVENKKPESEKNEMKGSVQQHFGSSYTVDDLTAQAADTWMKSTDKIEMVKAQLDLLKANGVAVSDQAQGFYDAMQSYATKRNEIVNILVEKAKENGVEKATTARNIRAAVKAVFPTSDAYVDAVRQNVNGAIGIMQYVLGFDKGEETPLFRKMLDISGKNAMELAENTTLKAETKAIYQK
jgi:hypothetical protein